MKQSESTVFLVEDDDDMRFSMERMIASVGSQGRSIRVSKHVSRTVPFDVSWLSDF